MKPKQAVSILSIGISILFSCFILSCSKSGSNPPPKNTAPTVTITSLSVSSGPYYTSVMIKGTGFSNTAAENQVTFNGKLATFDYANSEQLAVRVPLGAGTGAVKVSVNGVTATGPVFTYVPAEVVTTFAGGYSAGWADGAGEAASFSEPAGIALDASGNIYVADSHNYRIRKITPAGVVSTLAGSGVPGYADGQGTAASFSAAQGIAVDGAGNVYVADTDNSLIRKITPQGLVTTIAGDRLPHSNDGVGRAASFNTPYGVAADAVGNVYVADTQNSLIRKITPTGVVTTFAGNGSIGYADGQGTAASFAQPTGITLDKNGNLFVTDVFSSLVRKITPGGLVSRYAGGPVGSDNGANLSAKFRLPHGIAADGNGNVYVSDTFNGMIRLISNGNVSTFSGHINTTDFLNGPVASATFLAPIGIAVDGAGNIYVADALYNRIRKITFE
ncbi:hypothetical protein BH09BAC6_BH09BAC6_14020 [soil metagenome]|jgi:sugar lactone lactonase YvrE